MGYYLLNEIIAQILWSILQWFIIKSIFLLQMDYRSLVHEKDEAIYSEIRVMVLDIRGFYVSHLPSFIKQKAFIKTTLQAIDRNDKNISSVTDTSCF